jgi:hypothetical protein
MNVRSALALILTAMGAGVANATPAALPEGRVLFSPDIAAHPQEEAGYPRIIRLAHAGAANGTLLATFAHAGVPGEKGSQPIYRSTDGGKSWSARPIGVVRDTVHGWDIEAPALFELPVAQGDLPAGTLFAAGTAWNRRDFRQQAMEVFVSRDGGANWTYRSSCASEALQVNNEGHGIWEPFFAITADGSLNCFFSDERPSADGFGQVIAHVRSTDGGATWGPEIFDVGIRDGLARPGMPTVLRLPDGRYAMSFEDCQANADADHYCTVYLKTSPDGQDWTPIAGLGHPIATADGRRLLHTPTIAWTPYGGKNGTLIASGQRVVSGPDGHVTVEPQSGRVLMVNTALGEGPWREIPAPFRIDPTGGYGSGETACPGYSSAMVASDSANDASVLMVAGTAIANGKCEIRYGLGKVSPK